MESEAYVKLEMTKPKLATIEFFHPKSNSLPGHILAKLAETITKAGDDDDIQVIILKSGGEKAFCGGASFEELVAINDLDTGKKFFSGFANVINACRKNPKLIIGRVHGKAVGGGVGVAAAVDYCFATKFSDIKLSELNVGIGPFVVGPAVERKMGTSAMSQLAIKANAFLSAQWACDKGLYNEVYDDVKAMDKGIEDLAEFLISTNPEAQSMLKNKFWKGTEHWDKLLAERAADSGRLVLSDYTKKTLAKFAQK